MTERPEKRDIGFWNRISLSGGICISTEGRRGGDVIKKQEELSCTFIRSKHTKEYNFFAKTMIFLRALFRNLFVWNFPLTQFWLKAPPACYIMYRHPWNRYLIKSSPSIFNLTLIYFISFIFLFLRKHTVSCLKIIMQIGNVRLSSLVFFISALHMTHCCVPSKQLAIPMPVSISNYSSIDTRIINRWQKI